MIDVRAHDHEVTLTDREAALPDLHKPSTIVNVDHLERVMAVHAYEMTAIVDLKTHLEWKRRVEVTEIDTFGTNDGGALAVGVFPQ